MTPTRKPRSNNRQTQQAIRDARKAVETLREVCLFQSGLLDRLEKAMAALHESATAKTPH